MIIHDFSTNPQNTTMRAILLEHNYLFIYNIYMFDTLHLILDLFYLGLFSV